MFKYKYLNNFNLLNICYNSTVQGIYQSMAIFLFFCIILLIFFIIYDFSDFFILLLET